MHELWRWFLHITGSSNVSGPWYGFWSGFGSDLGEVAIIGGLYKAFNCHTDGCLRVGVHHVPGTTFKTCRRHHPNGGNKHQHILEAYHKAREK